MSSTVHIAGAGVISAIGNSWSENFFSLRNGISGISGMMVLDSRHSNSLPVGEVKLTNEELAYRTGVRKPVTRTALLGIHAAKEAYLDSGIRNMNFWRVGVVSGSMMGGMDKSEKFFPLFLEDISAGKLRDVVNHPSGRCTELISDALEVDAHITTISAGSSSSANAIITGARLIRHNHLDVVFAGGTDALSKFALEGLISMGVVDTKVCRPLDKAAAGLNPAEGAAYVVLVSDRVVEEENLKPFAFVNGFSNVNDAFHHTFISPEGKGILHAMKKALGMASLSTGDIDYLHLNSCGVAGNDLSEALAVKRLFDGDMPRVSSTHGFTGHAFGASGAIDAVFALMGLRHQCVMPHLGFDSPVDDAELSPQREFEQMTVKHVMSNSIAFGGPCSSIILSSANQRLNG